MIQIDTKIPNSCLRCICSRTFSESPFWDCYCIPLQRHIREHESDRRQKDCPLKEVVMCKDCKNWTEWENGAGSCQRSDSVMWLGTDATDFCSFAERKDND